MEVVRSRTNSTSDEALACAEARGATAALTVAAAAAAGIHTTPAVPQRQQQQQQQGIGTVGTAASTTTSSSSSSLAVDRRNNMTGQELKSRSLGGMGPQPVKHGSWAATRTTIAVSGHCSFQGHWLATVLPWWSQPLQGGKQ
jgi:hypothetical protein